MPLISARRYQYTDGCSRQGWQTRVLAGRLPPCPSSLHPGHGQLRESAANRSTVAVALVERPARLLHATQPTFRALTLGKLSNAWPLGAPAEWCDPEGLTSFLHWAHTRVLTAILCLPYVPHHNIFQAPGQVHYTHPHFLDLLSWTWLCLRWGCCELMLSNKNEWNHWI